uniref:DUF1985 domain-containing protein n=1 Tax=Brassica oleracea var. oleracea TaxID=109376 RepID=A0A0D2ZUA4_BRAOL
NPNAVSLKGDFEGDFRRFSLIHRSLRRLSLRRLFRRYHRRSLRRSAASFLSTVLPLPFSPPFEPPVISPPPIYNRVLKATISSPNFQAGSLHARFPAGHKESKLGVFIKFQELGFEWPSRLVHYMLGFQLNIKKEYELWSLVGPEPVSFSLLEFESLTGLNCKYIEDLERPQCVVTKELTSFCGMLGVHVEAGSSTEEIIAAFGRCEGWSRDDRKRPVYLAIFTGYIEGRKYSTPTRVWVYTALPELGATFGNPLPNNPSPPILAYKGRKGRIQFKEAILSQLAVVSPAKKKVVKKHLKEDCSRPRKKARKEAPAEDSEEATAEAREEATAVGRSEVTTPAGGLTKEDIKAMLKDVVDAMSEGFGTCLKEIKYLSERLEAVEKKVGINTKWKGTSSQNAGTQTRTGTSSQNAWTQTQSESVNGTNAGRKSLPEDKGPDVPTDASSSKDKAPETSLSLVLLDKTQSTVLD